MTYPPFLPPAFAACLIRCQRDSPEKDMNEIFWSGHVRPRQAKENLQISGNFLHWEFLNFIQCIFVPFLQGLCSLARKSPQIGENLARFAGGKECLSRLCLSWFGSSKLEPFCVTEKWAYLAVLASNDPKVHAQNNQSSPNSCNCVAAIPPKIAQISAKIRQSSTKFVKLA